MEFAGAVILNLVDEGLRFSCESFRLIAFGLARLLNDAAEVALRIEIWAWAGFKFSF